MKPISGIFILMPPKFHKHLMNKKVLALKYRRWESALVCASKATFMRRGLQDVHLNFLIEFQFDMKLKSWWLMFSSTLWEKLAEKI